MDVRHHNNERGFVLVTSLVVLMILTVMLLGLYLRNKSNQESSVSSRDSTQAYYLAEAGINYITWALYYNSTSTTNNNSQDLDNNGTADNTEIKSYPNQASAGSSHQVGYLDLNNTIGYDPSSPSSTTLSSIVTHINNHDMKHVELDITLSAGSSPSVSANYGTGYLTPSGDGAVVWLVPAVMDDTNPLNEKDSTDTSANYAIYAYSVGYVHGKPLRVLRAKLGDLTTGFPDTLGAITNGFNP